MKKKIKRELTKINEKIRCGNFLLDTDNFIETLPNGIKHTVSYKKWEVYKILKNLKYP